MTKSSSSSGGGSRGGGGGYVGVSRRRRGPLKSSLGLQIKKDVVAISAATANHNQDDNGAASGSSFAATMPYPSSSKGREADSGSGKNMKGNRRRGPIVSSRGERVMLFMKAGAPTPHTDRTSD
mmetsp:Transcript_28390/g.39621  ORF Transcript_28390/g.39621 Transcript_28390/m.39621 type:complete len:124 (+) Transcript_28390:172-543(+)